MSKAWCCLQQLAQKLLKMHLLMFILKRCFGFCLYSVETMQKLIKDRTVLSQSCVSCIQIWSHIIYSSWSFRTVLALQLQRPGCDWRRSHGNQRERNKNTEDTEWRNVVTTFLYWYLFCTSLYFKVFLCEKAFLFMFVQCIVNVFCYKHSASCR